MPIPYLGSKDKLKKDIFEVINNHTKGKRKKDLLVDLFTGGFSISEYFLKQGWTIICNDSNKYIMALLEKTQTTGLPKDIIYKWISREQFFDIINNPSKYEDWYVGFVMSIWSFGNNQTGYIYGKSIEHIKKIGEDFVIRGQKNDILYDIFTDEELENLLKIEDTSERRRKFCRFIKEKQKSKGLKRLQALKRIESIIRIESIERIERFERIERIERIDYKKVNIPEDAIVYCDPPYENTAKYKNNSINHKEFWDYIRKISKTNMVFVSEYNAPEDFVCIFQKEKNVRLARDSNNKKSIEKLFVHKDCILFN